MTLKLKIDKFEDIHYLSALTQDSIIDKESFNFENDKFLILINRFKWENYHEQKYRRIHSGLLFNHVEKVTFDKDFMKDDDIRFLNLLSIITDYSKRISLIFSGEKVVNIYVNSVDIKIKDLHYSWATDNIPYHDLAL